MPTKRFSGDSGGMTLEGVAKPGHAQQSDFQAFLRLRGMLRVSW
jgi:hypothetical protein